MKHKFPNAVIQVFCKAPIAGQVKTRLMPHLSAKQAAQVHRRLSRRTLELVSSSALCPIELWCSPDILHPFFKELSRQFPITLHTQSSGNLGQRMHRAILHSSQTYNQLILIGCDCPSLTLSDLNEALTALSTHKNIVLAPAEDGGYCLIGMNTPHLELFTDIHWGTSEVLKSTQKKIQALALNNHELNTQWDVDNYTDYLRFLDLPAIPFKK